MAAILSQPFENLTHIQMVRAFENWRLNSILIFKPTLLSMFSKTIKNMVISSCYPAIILYCILLHKEEMRVR
jgi:hypothetical protein